MIDRGGANHANALAVPELAANGFPLCSETHTAPKVHD